MENMKSEDSYSLQLINLINGVENMSGEVKRNTKVDVYYEICSLYREAFANGDVPLTTILAETIKYMESH
jgi:hypothetical protein